MIEQPSATTLENATLRGVEVYKAAYIDIVKVQTR
tara:strand:- start:371 stop:475 length:105 start_codon:yes stop_codon:yes gene_type:complete